MTSKTFFTRQLLYWYDHTENRNLPWKEGKNPYYTWLSEIMLQQTRLEQGLPYYLRFVEQYPKLVDLANAPEDDVLKLWQGLGYYARARNMHATAKFIRDNYAGEFPKTYEEIRALKGIGDYTAAAIASFAFDLAHAVVDGNVYRVLSRYFNIETAIDSTDGKKQFSKLANELLDPNRPADFNQAIMDIGATVCKPVSPLCQDCPIAEKCSAFAHNNIENLPFKSKKLVKKDRHFYYFVWRNAKGETVIKKRAEKDIWQGLYDFPLIESTENICADNDFSKIWESATWKRWTEDQHTKEIPVKISTTYRQLLTHQNILAIFVEVYGEIPNIFFADNYYTIIRIEDLRNFALPKTLQYYLEKDLFPWD